MVRPSSCCSRLPREVVASRPMLERIWLSLAWFFGVVGAVLGAWLAWAWIQDTRESIDKNEFDSLIMSVMKTNPSYLCWMESWEHSKTVYVRSSDEPAPSYATKQLDPKNCVYRLGQMNEELEKKIPWFWAGLIAALTLWPALVYGIYRWGLWLVRGSKTTAATTSAS